MLSLLLFIAGMCELVDIKDADATIKKVFKLKEKFKSEALTRVQRGKLLEEHGLMPMIYRNLFKWAALGMAALTAFKVTFWYLLPIWVLSLCFGRFKRNKIFFIADGLVCAALYVTAALVVAQ